MATTVQTPIVNESSLAQVLEDRRRAVRRAEYQMLGQIAVINTERGRMDFRKVGPVMVQTPAGALALLDPWPGLPDLMVASDKLCRACQTKCDECDGAGTRACTLLGCGGVGKQTINRKECPDCVKKTGRFNVDCLTCGGRGDVPAPRRCPNCKGRGSAACALCHGSGKMSTGKLRGSKKKDAPVCKACDGNKRAAQFKAQDWRKFYHGHLEQYVTLGPVTSIVFHNVGPIQERNLFVCKVRPDDKNNLMVVLLEGVSPGSSMHLIGGLPQL